jgi:hypothetical protein
MSFTANRDMFLRYYPVKAPRLMRRRVELELPPLLPKVESAFDDPTDGQDTKYPSLFDYSLQVAPQEEMWAHQAQPNHCRSLAGTQVPVLFDYHQSPG